MPKAQHQQHAAQGSHAPAPPPQRLLAPIGWIEARFNRGRFDYAAGELITNPDESDMLRRRGAQLEPCPVAASEQAG